MINYKELEKQFIELLNKTPIEDLDKWLSNHEANRVLVKDCSVNYTTDEIIDAMPSNKQTEPDKSKYTYSSEDKCFGKNYSMVA